MSEKDVSSRRDVLKVAGVLVAGVAASVLTAEKASAQKKPPRWAMVIDMRRVCWLLFMSGVMQDGKFCSDGRL